MTSWSKGDLVVIPGVIVDESDEAGDVRVTVEAPDRGAVGLPTQMIYCVPDNALRRADDGVTDAIRERDELRARVEQLTKERDAERASVGALRLDCDGSRRELRCVRDERDDLRRAVRSIGAAAKIPCVGIMDMSYCERVRDAVGALRSDEATVERDAERDALMAENKKIQRALAAALQLVGECALSDYMSGGER